MGCSDIGCFALLVLMFIVVSVADQASDESQIDRNAGLSCDQAIGEERLGKTK
jgi:hypothetical protein